VKAAEELRHRVEADVAAGWAKLEVSGVAGGRLRYAWWQWVLANSLRGQFRFLGVVVLEKESKAFGTTLCYRQVLSMCQSAVTLC